MNSEKEEGITEGENRCSGKHQSEYAKRVGERIQGMGFLNRDFGRGMLNY